MLEKDEIVIGISQAGDDIFLHTIPTDRIRVDGKRIRDTGGLIYKAEGIEYGCVIKKVKKEELGLMALAETRFIKLLI